jgi:hypothetical protein
MLHDMVFELMGAICAAGDVGDELDATSPRHWDEELDASSEDDCAYWDEEPTDGGPMTLDELNASSWQEEPADGGPMTLDELTVAENAV